MLSLLKKWFIWAVGALLIAGGAFFMYPVPENGGRETVQSAASGEEQPAPDNATPTDAGPAGEKEAGEKETGEKEKKS